MRLRSRLLIVSLAALLLAGTVAYVPAVRADIGDILKGAGIVLLVDQFGGQVNNFINKITFNKGVGVQDQTKVVPIISIGQSGYVGAAQISGPALKVDQVKAVAQLEGSFSGKTFRVKALVPVESKDIKNIKRVTGVGVSAIIDVKL